VVENSTQIDIQCLCHGTARINWFTMLILHVCCIKYHYIFKSLTIIALSFVILT